MESFHPHVVNPDNASTLTSQSCKALENLAEPYHGAWLSYRAQLPIAIPMLKSHLRRN